jgi:predicted enzyme related to lactoylglutathione lyase
MLPAGQVTWVYTADLPGTARFYAETLGFDMVLDQGLCRIFRAAPHAFVGVCQVRPGRWVEPKGVVVTFVLPTPGDVDAWHAKLVANGAKPEGAPFHSETFNVRAFFLLDPNGYRLEFQAFLDPAWKG